MSPVRAAPTRRFWWAGLLLGFGFGGLFDGIVLHQLLQWHHLVSRRVSPDTLSGLQTNVFADGVLSAVMTLLLGLGFALLWRELRAAPRPSTRALTGLLLLGWGAFNVYDTFIDHGLLRLHHIREGHGHNALAYDLWFFASALALLAVGWAVLGRDRR